MYWQDKLRSNKDIDFPDSLLEYLAAKTDNFSFAYMKRFCEWYSPAEFQYPVLTSASVSTLLTLAGREAESDFATILLQQVKKLREELAAGSGSTMVASLDRAGGTSDVARAMSEPMRGGQEEWFRFEMVNGQQMVMS